MNVPPDRGWPMPNQVDPDGPGHETWEEIDLQLNREFAEAELRHRREFERLVNQRRTARAMKSAALFCLAVAGAALVILLVVAIGWLAYRYVPAEARSVYHFFSQN